MYSVSNKQYGEIIKFLKVLAQLYDCAGDIQAKNQRRKALLLMRQLSKRKPYDKRSTRR